MDGFGLLGLDGDGWRKILVSKSYGTITADLTPLEEFLALDSFPLTKIHDYNQSK